MDVKHVHKTTLIDFPGYIAAIVFVGNCNFSCDYCYNWDLVFEPDELPSISIDETINILKNLKYIDGVVITGGEPTIHLDLKNFLERIKQETDLKIKLDTNCYKPEVLKEVIELVDYVAIDLKSSFSTYSEIVGVEVDTNKILEGIRFIQDSNIDHELRTTLWKGHPFLNTYTEAFDVIKNSKYFIQNFYSRDEDKHFDSLSKIEAIELKTEFEKENIIVSLRGDYY